MRRKPARHERQQAAGGGGSGGGDSGRVTRPLRSRSNSYAAAPAPPHASPSRRAARRQCRGISAAGWSDAAAPCMDGITASCVRSLQAGHVRRMSESNCMTAAAATSYGRRRSGPRPAWALCRHASRLHGASSSNRTHSRPSSSIQAAVKGWLGCRQLLRRRAARPPRRSLRQRAVRPRCAICCSYSCCLLLLLLLLLVGAAIDVHGRLSPRLLLPLGRRARAPRLRVLRPSRAPRRVAHQGERGGAAGTAGTIACAAQGDAVLLVKPKVAVADEQQVTALQRAPARRVGRHGQPARGDGGGRAGTL